MLDDPPLYVIPVRDWASWGPKLYWVTAPSFFPHFQLIFLNLHSHCPASCSIQGGRGLDLKLGLSLPSYACEVSSLSHWMRSLQSPTTSSGFSSPANVIPASCLASARHMAFPTSPLYDCFHILQPAFEEPNAKNNLTTAIITCMGWGHSPGQALPICYSLAHGNPVVEPQWKPDHMG